MSQTPIDNQHKHIEGYRNLTKEDIALMNELKEAGENLLSVLEKAKAHVSANQQAAVDAHNATNGIGDPHPAPLEECAELVRINKAEPFRWAAIAKTHIQEGVTAAVRVVAQPGGNI